MRDDERRHGNRSGSRVRRVTEGRLWETSVSSCRNKVTLFHVLLKTLSQWTETGRLPQADAEIRSGKVAASGPQLSGKGGDRNDTQIPTAAF